MIFLVVVCCFVIRALARAYVQKKNGIDVREICVGYPVRFVTYTFHFRGVRIILSPVFFGSSKLPEGKLNLSQKLDIAGTGVIACVVWAVFLMFIVLPIPQWRLITALIAFNLVFFRRAISVYLLPCLVFLVGGGVAIVITIALIKILTFSATIPDHFSMVAAADPIKRSLVYEIFSGAGDCLLMAFVNLMPFPRLDGGRIAQACFQAWRER